MYDQLSGISRQMIKEKNKLILIFNQRKFSACLFAFGGEQRSIIITSSNGSSCYNNKNNTLTL